MINDIFEQLASDSGRNFKIDLLQKHAKNNLLRSVVFLALDPFTQFYIRKIPSYTRSSSPAIDLGYAVGELSKLSSRQLTGNAAIEFLAKLLSDLDPEDAQVIERIIQKDLKCGVSDSTVNKVWPGLVAEYPCMLASAYDQKLIDKVKFPAYVQLKLDGMRFNAIVKQDSSGVGATVEFRSRNGKEININDYDFGFPFIYMAAGQNVVFDGELLIKENGQILDRKTGNGILNKAVKGTQSEAEGALVCATLWDMIPLKDFEAGVHKKPYEERVKLLSSAIMHASNPRIDLVAMQTVNNIEEAQSLFEQYLAQGQEGIILKTKDMIWENKRSKHQIKFKQVVENELRVVGYQWGTGKNEGLLGALVCESEDGIIKVNVGTGFTEEQRALITPDNIMGSIITVAYNVVINDKTTGVYSLFLPRFIEVRMDKAVADSARDFGLK